MACKFSVDLTEILDGHRTETDTTIWCAAARLRRSSASRGTTHEDMASRYARKRSCAATSWSSWICVTSRPELVCHDGQEFNYALKGRHPHLRRPRDIQRTRRRQHLFQPHLTSRLQRCNGDVPPCKFITIIAWNSTITFSKSSVSENHPVDCFAERGLLKSKYCAVRRTTESREKHHLDHVLKKVRIEFDSYETENFNTEVPEAFNPGFDVVDEWPPSSDKRALLWNNDAGEERVFTFTDIKRLSNQAANALRSSASARATWSCASCAAAGSTGVRRGPLGVGRHHHPRVAAAHAQGCGVPRQQRRREGHRRRERRVRLHAGGRGHARLPHGAREKFIDGLPRGLGRFRAIAGYPDTFERPTGEAGVTSKDIMLMYFHERNDGQPWPWSTTSPIRSATS